MDEVLREAMEPVLRDLSSAGLASPRLDGDDWIGDPAYPSVMMWAPDGSGTGISVQRSASPKQPSAGSGHVRGTAVWRCPVDGAVVAQIGRL